MRGSKWALALSLAVAVAIPAAWAEDDAAPDKGWTNKAEFGFVSTTGNSQTNNFAFANKFVRTWTTSELEVNASALRTENTTRILSNPDGTVAVDEVTETTAEAYALGGKYTHKIRDGLGWYANARWSRNRFSGIDSRIIGGGGLSYTFFADDVHKLVGEVGADFTDEQRVDDTSDSYAGVRAFAGYLRKFGKNSEFSSELELLDSVDDTDDWRANWSNSVTASLTDRLALKVSYTMLYDNQPVVVLVAPDPGAPPGTPSAEFEFDELDTVLSASLVVNF